MEGDKNEEGRGGESKNGPKKKKFAARADFRVVFCGVEDYCSSHISSSSALLLVPENNTGGESAPPRPRGAGGWGKHDDDMME